jgi:hypothetical protein
VSTDATDWETLTPRLSLTGTGNSLSFAGDRFIAGAPGTSSGLWLSTDGQVWTASDFIPTLNSTLVFRTAAYGNGLFVLVGHGSTGMSYILFSDGVAWGTAAVNPVLQGVAFKDDVFVAVGSAGAIYTSTNAFHWYTADSPTTKNLNSITVGEGKFLAVADAGVVMTSTDGIQWNSTPTSTTNNLQSVVYGNGLFVAVGLRGSIITSPDGLNWNSQPSGTSTPLRQVAFGSDIFVVIGDNATILASTDGDTWIRKGSGSGNVYNGVAYGAGKFLIEASSGMIEADISKGVLETPRVTPDGVILNTSGEVGRVYDVQAASSLSPPDWTKIGSVTNNHLTVPFVDKTAAGLRNRYYRTVLVP